MVQLTRSSLKHLLYQNGHRLRLLNRPTCRFISTQLQTDYAPTTLLQNDNTGPIDRRLTASSWQFNTNNHMVESIEKNAKVELIEALENILQVRKSFGLQSKSRPSSLKDETELYHEISSWKSSMNRAIASNNIQLAIELFYSSPDHIAQARDASIFDTYRRLIFRTPAEDTQTAIDVFEASEDFFANAQEIVEGTSLTKLVNSRQQILKRMIKVLSLVDPQPDPSFRFRNTLSYISSAIQCTTEATLQHELYPLLMSALLKKPVVFMVAKFPELQKIEKEIWNSAIHSLKMMDLDFVKENPRLVGFYNVVLSQSTYRKQQDLPFVFLIKTLVDKGFVPTAEVFLNIVHNEYPYENLIANRCILKAILRLQRNKPASKPDYILDVGTLEHLSSVLSRKGNSSEMMDLWEYIQQIQQSGNPYYHPTIGLYENLARACASSKKREDELVFSVLATMEDQGFQPSYIFIKGLSQSMRTRSTVSRLDKASHLLRNKNIANYDSDDMENPTIRASTSALNSIISGYADLGLFDKAYSIYNSFQDLNCEPDENTFIFMLDALLMNASTAIPPGYRSWNHEWITLQGETADILVQEATYKGFQSATLLEKYVEILCVIGNVEKARNILVDIVLDAEQNSIIPDITLNTFSRVALNYASSHDLVGAEEIEKLCLVSGYQGLPEYVKEHIRRLRQNGGA